jgi:hypothetical protein
MELAKVLRLTGIALKSPELFKGAAENCGRNES